MADKPNILFILSDDHAVQAISALKRGRTQLNQTPNLDRIADEGAIFSNSFCCNSICTPSRASILTGKHSLQNGVLTLSDALADDQVTFGWSLITIIGPIECSLTGFQYRNGIVKTDIISRLCWKSRGGGVPDPGACDGLRSLGLVGRRE